MALAKGLLLLNVALVAYGVHVFQRANEVKNLHHTSSVGSNLLPAGTRRPVFSIKSLICTR